MTLPSLWLERPVLAPDVEPLTWRERRAIALAALGHRNAEVEEALRVRRTASVWGPIWKKLGLTGTPRCKAAAVFSARVCGALDLPDPADPGPLPEEVFALVRAYALGESLKQHAEDLRVPVPVVTQRARLARIHLKATTQPHMVYLALPQLLRAVRPPVTDADRIHALVHVPPVTNSLHVELPGDRDSVTLVRAWLRTSVDWLRWNGDAPRAVEVAGRLVDNAVRHGQPKPGTRHKLAVGLRVDDVDDLVIDVTDANPLFPNFAAAREGMKGRGLAQVARLGATVSYSPHPDQPGKTVRARLPRRAGP